LPDALELDAGKLMDRTYKLKRAVEKDEGE
jgi:hypothetical protein